MECKKCNANIEVQDALKCIGCKVKYHYKCAGMSELNYKKLNKAAKSMWRCLGCKTGKNRLSTSSGGKEDKKETDTDLFDKQRMSLLNDLEDNSDDVDGDLEMKESNKSDTLTEEDTHESTPKVKVAAGNESTASISSVSATERRSNRIMTRKQRDSELRLQFAKKLKITPQQRPKQVLPNSARRFSKSDLNTSDSEAYSSPVLPKKTPSGGISAKKPALPLGNKRKSSLEYAKNKKLMRKNDEGVGDTTTTTDDNDDEEDTEDEHKHNTKTKKNKNTNQNVKRKLGNQTTTSAAAANVKRKKKDETTDEDDDSDDDDDSEEDESDDSDDTETDLEEELKKAISKKFPLYKNSPATDSRMKKPMNNNHVARGGLKNSSSVGGSGQKKQIPTRPSSSTSSVNKSTPKNSKQVTITGSRVITKTMDRQFKNETISNVGNSKLYGGAGNSSKNIESMKIYYPNIDKKNASSSASSSSQQNSASRGNMSSQRNKMVPASKRFNNSTLTSSVNNNVGKTIESTTPPDEQIMSASPKAKSEFDKLVDELFETETTREKLSDKEPEIMLIDNEPTDVYTLNIDDTLEDDSDLEALMEEVYEDETIDETSMGNLTSGGVGNSTLSSSYLSDNRTNTLNSNTTSMNTAASLGYNTNMNVTPLGHMNTQSSRHTTRTPHQILNVNSPMISPKNVNSKTRTPQQKEISLKNAASTNSAPVSSRNVSSSNGVNKSGVETPKQISRLGSQVSVTPVTKTPPTPAVATKSTANQKMTGGGGGEKRTPNQNIGGVGGEKQRGSSSFGIDYKEKYNKLLTSYEMLSAKIAQYMEKTKQEKDQLKRQLKLEKNKLEKAQEDIEILKKKFEYLMKNKPSSSTTGGSSKKKA